MSNAPQQLGPKKVVGKPVKRPERTAAVQTYIPEIARGLGITMSHFFKNTKEMVLGQRPDPSTESVEAGINTVSYPEQRRPYPARFRGMHRLTDRGLDRCIDQPSRDDFGKYGILRKRSDQKRRGESQAPASEPRTK